MYRQFKNMANKTERILVHFYNETGNHKANFTQSILDVLGLEHGDDMLVFAELKHNNMLLGNTPWTESHRSVKLKRPSFCPLHNLSEDQARQLPADILARGVDVGCATIVETGDNNVLLTRRATHLRTFPNVWVPPGGHVELNETLHEAGLRELKEETGLILSAEDCVHGNIPILALWESCYPPKLSVGLPRRHHIVVYLYARLRPELTVTALQSRLHPDPGEVGACAWLDRSTMENVLRLANEEDTDNISVDLAANNLPALFSATIVHPDGSLEKKDLPSSILYQKAPEEGTDVERISTGTKFALEEWLSWGS